MNKIKILPPSEAQKIAAGEIVERPSSVVKELIENSIDASATQISLFIEKAGKELIKIVDNGCGMSKVDAKLSIHPHATSKISSLNDLENISTFGFRGEALAAISSVSRFELITKEPDSKTGYKLVFDNEFLVEESEVSAQVGTQISIRELFFNTPVRKKFLKQDETEWNQIETIFKAFCFCYPNISFKLYRDNKIFINAPAVNSIKDRVIQIYDNNFAQNLIYLEQSSKKNNNLEISGLISAHQAWFYNKSNVYFFVNNRLVKNTALAKALLKGYLNVLPEGRFPAGVIFFNLDPKTIDVNVHPRKEEVKFSKPLIIENCLWETVKKTLENYISSKISKTSSAANNFYQPNANSVETDVAKFNFGEVKPENLSSTNSLKHAKPFEFNYQSLPLEKMEPTISKVQNQATKTIENFERIIGQLFNTYILIEKENELVIIDQHAAHERILYEKFKNKFLENEGTKLLFPELVHLSTHQANLLSTNKEMFRFFGIELEEFGNNAFAIKSSPPILKNAFLKELILEAVSFLEENEKLSKDEQRKIFFEKIHSTMSCKAAIKAGDILSDEQIKQLIKDLNSCENRLICVHGRPTIWVISKNQLEKNFQRKL